MSDHPDLQPRLLVVDDLDINRTLVGELLEDRYYLAEAEDGQNGLDRLRGGDIDLVLLDLNMPGLSGFDVLAQLQQQGSTVPVIVLSADRDAESISRAFQLGAADYINTPFNADELRARVDTQLRLHEREQKLEHRVRQRSMELVQSNRRLNELHQQLVHSEKMAVIGQLAAGVAHEINNPIGYINANLNSLRDYSQDVMELLDAYEQAETMIGDDATREQLAGLRQRIDLDFIRDDLRNLLRESLMGIDRVKTIVRNLRGFAHADEEDQWTMADIHEGLESSLNIAHNEIKYKARVERHYGDLPPIECIPTQLNQVFLNLLVNAAQAIAQDGLIQIITGMRDAEHIFIRISDNGCGIPPDVQHKVFEPFFTTKPVDQGTGLGLSISYGIMEKHRGRFLVASDPGLGTTFTLELPVAQPRGAPANATDTATIQQ